MTENSERIINLLEPFIENKRCNRGERTAIINAVAEIKRLDAALEEAQKQADKYKHLYEKHISGIRELSRFLEESEKKRAEPIKHE